MEVNKLPRSSKSQKVQVSSHPNPSHWREVAIVLMHNFKELKCSKIKSLNF